MSKDITAIDTKDLKDVSKMKRNDVIPYYLNLIKDKIAIWEFGDGKEIERINNLILSKWKPSGLLYIKDKAWKIYNQTYKTDTNG